VPALPALEERRATARLVTGRVVRSPTLHHSLRAFCLGAFAAVTRELDAGGEIPFAFEEHQAPDRPTLYEYRPLVKPFLDARAGRFAALADAQPALAELEREPAAAIFAQAHSSGRPSSREALTRTVLLPLLAETAEACGGFDWDDDAFERAYAAFEASLFGATRAYGAMAPVVGLSIRSGVVELGGDIRIRHVASGEISAHWPQSGGLLPEGFEREPDRLCVLELESELEQGAGTGVPDAPGELADCVTALRLATAGPIAAGPVLFERLDWRPYGIRPVLPIAATQPPGEPIRLDAVRAARATRLRERLALSDDDRELGEALDRWELSLFQPDPFASEQLRSTMTSLLGGGEGLFAGSLRAAVALGETPRERSAILDRLRLLAAGDAAAATGDLVRRALVAVLEHGDRKTLIRALDETLVGLRPKPALEEPETAVAAGAL
jgi:hypothetical protein